ncbi:MAG: two pore domain potassium channel family protein [bacterium]|nr:two pore domain potassium channel family protein [bacterium]
MVSADQPTRPGAERATEQYGRVFLMLVVVLFFVMFIEESRWARVLVGLGVILVVLLTLKATGVTPRTMCNTWFVVGALAVLVVSGGYTDAAEVIATIGFAIAAALVVSVLMLLRRVFEKDRIRIAEVVAALAAYIQIGLAFGFVFSATAALSEGDFFNNGVAGQASDFFYFSVVTMTTLGYGDLSPATDIGRSLVIVETLLGQIFLIVLVAYLVGMLGSSRRAIGSDS